MLVKYSKLYALTLTAIAFIAHADVSPTLNNGLSSQQSTVPSQKDSFPQPPLIATSSVSPSPVSSSQVSTASSTAPTVPPSVSSQNYALPATSHTASPPPGQQHIWNLQGVDIRSVIDEVSRETGKNFLVDPQVQGKVTVISSAPLNSDEIYQVFLSMLQTLGYAALPSDDGIIKITPINTAKRLGLPAADWKNPGRGDRLVTAVIPIKNVNASDLVSILNPMIPDWGSVSAYAASNILIISSTANSIHHLNRIIEEVDKASNNDIEIMSLNHANATKLVSIINSLQGLTTQQNTANRINLAADEDNNSILMSGGISARIKMRALIAQLDSPAPGNHGNTEVIYLRYQDAQKLSPILSKIVGSLDKGKIGVDNAKALIAADPTTNSLIINASPTEIKTLNSIINQLDVRPAEVLVEAIIVEVDESTLNRLGIEWGTVGVISAGTTGNTNDSLDNLAAPISSSAAAFLPYTGIIRTGSLAVILSALEKNGNNDLLSTPDLMVLDNQKASIQVGQQISVQSGSYADSGGSTSSVQPFNTVNRQNVGLSVNVTPHISQGSVVQLTIDVENDSLSNPQSNSLNPNVNTSGVNTSVLINSGDILVLGGLISNASQNSNNQIPWIGNIPGLGYLFKFADHSSQKSNLMIFLRPVIMNTAEQTLKETGKKYNYIRDQQATYLHDDKNSFMAPHEQLLPYWPNQQPIIPEPFSNASKK